MTDTIAALNSTKKQPKRRFARDPNAAAQTPALPSDTDAPSPAPAPAKSFKISTVVALLERSEGATLAEMIDATGWLSHTTRAALTGLRKKGHALEKSKRDDVTCYRIVSRA